MDLCNDNGICKTFIGRDLYFSPHLPHLNTDTQLTNYKITGEIKIREKSSFLSTNLLELSLKVYVFGNFLALFVILVLEKVHIWSMKLTRKNILL